MTITKQQADDAQAKIDADKPALAAMQAELIKDQAAFESMRLEVSSDQAEANRLSADILAQQVIVDQFNNQSPPPPPPADTGGFVIPQVRSPVSGFTMPRMPDMPQGMLTKRSPMDVKTNGQNITLHGNHVSGSYIWIDHSNKALRVGKLELVDTLVDANGGSAFYSGSMCGGDEAFIDRMAGKDLRPGRMLLRFCGVWGKIVIPNLYAAWKLDPNTMEGNIATAVQFGNKAVGEHIASVHLGNVFGGANRDAWGSSKYWNGDGGGTAERTVDELICEMLTAVGSPDAGFDTKAKNNRFGLVYSDGNREALKLWNKTFAEQVESHNAHAAGGIGGSSHLRLMGFGEGSTKQPPLYEFPKVWFDGTAPAIRAEQGMIEVHMAGHYEGPPKMVTLNGASLKPESTWNGSAFTKAMLA